MTCRWRSRGNLADYLDDRGGLLLSQGVSDPDDPFEKANRDAHRRAIELAAEIRGQTRSI
jgi:sugar phosphate isomerase/epimerase